MKMLMVLALFLILTGLAYAALPAYESITVANTAIGFTESIYNSGPTQKVVCVLETAQIRVRADGTNPTSSEGQLIEVGQSLCLGKCNSFDSLASLKTITNFRAIRTGASSGTLKCSFE